MEKIGDCIKLYSLMAKRCNLSGFEDCQAQVYSEMIDFITDCKDTEEATLKIKNSKYYLAPSIAYTKDKLIAWAKAARELKLHDLEEIYSNMIAFMSNNNQANYQGAETKVLNTKNKYLNSMQAFFHVFNSYVSFLCSGEQAYIHEINNNLNNILWPTTNFEDISKIDCFRNLIPLNDSAYQKYVKQIIDFKNNGQIETHYKTEENLDGNFEQLKARKNEVLCKANNADKSNLKKVIAHVNNEEKHYIFEEKVDHPDNLQLFKKIIDEEINTDKSIVECVLK